jgi:hypothetical protein
MKTKRNTRKLVPKQHQHSERNPATVNKRLNVGEFAPEEELAEKHFSIDEDWQPVRKSKGADEEG